MREDRGDDAQYDTFEGFLRTALRAHYRSERSRADFLALLLASREALAVAAGELFSKATAKRVLTGAAGATAMALLLRALLGGPLGALATGATITSLVALYGKRHRGITARAAAFRELIAAQRPRYREVQEGFEARRITKEQRDLMCDGLIRRFLADLDASAPPDSPTDAAGEAQSFRAHLREKKDAEAHEKRSRRDPR